MLDSVSSLGNNIQAFFALVRAGLWEQEVRLSQFEETDFNEVYRLAEELSVAGLVAAGLEHIVDTKVPQKDALAFVGSALQLEQRNLSMNGFVARLIEKLRKDDVYAILIKGQGIAQCYERPLWRASGDVDLLLNEENYQRAKAILIPKATSAEIEYTSFKHLAMMIGDFEVELHGTLHTRLSKRVDRVIDAVQADVFYCGSVRSWQDGDIQVFLPAVNNDVIFIFTHILHHFYVEGIGLRQFCDWCRFLWTYRGEIDVTLLEKRLRAMGLMSEWRTFAEMAIDWLGMPTEAMPLYSADAKWKRKAEYVVTFVLECGNFGLNRKKTVAKSYLGGKWNSLLRKIRDFRRHARVFPWDSVRFFIGFLRNGIGQAARGE